MYPYLKLAVTLIRAKFRSKLVFEGTSTLKLRAGLTDIDMFMELNNARYFTYMELAIEVRKATPKRAKKLEKF